MIVDQAPSGLDQATRVALGKRLGPFDEVLHIEEARFMLQAYEYRASITRGRKLTVFEKAAFGLLSAKGEMEPSDLGRMLGFSEKDGDFATRLCKRLFDLKAISGDENGIALTETGKLSAETGSIPEIEQTSFDILLVASDSQEINEKPIPRKMATDLMKKVEWHSTLVGSAPSIEKVLLQAAEQHPDLHSPDNGVRIDSASLKRQKDGHVTMVQRCALVHSKLDKSIRLVPIPRERDPEANRLLTILAGSSKSELNRIFQVYEGKTQSNSSAGDEDRSIVSGIITQMPDERDTIIEQLQAAITQKDQAQEKELKAAYAALSPKYFSTFDFEEEMLRIFARSKIVWIKSPFVRQSAMRERGRQIENALRRKATVILVASKTEGNQQKNVDQGVREYLNDLNRKEERFLFIESDIFHSKLLFSFAEDISIYQGSFNILSFLPRETDHKIRDETMVRLPWDKAGYDFFDNERMAVLSALEEKSSSLKKTIEGRKKSNPAIADKDMEARLALYQAKAKLVLDLNVPLPTTGE